MSKIKQVWSENKIFTHLVWRKKVISLLILIWICSLLFTRFYGISWGLPFPMNPDERNIALSIIQLSCKSFDTSCFHPHFFAYGQFSIYIAYLLVKLFHGTIADLSRQISLSEALYALRILSATVAVSCVYVLIRIIRLFDNKHTHYLQNLMLGIVFIFSPVLIQFAHFGTTESLLMLFTTLLAYFSLSVLKDSLSLKKSAVYSAIVFGLAVGTKISAVSLGVIPFLTFIFLLKRKPKWIIILFGHGILFTAITLITAILASPHNILSWQDFIGSMRYESSVGTGTYRAFYTHQFENTIPIVFQILTIAPYAIGIVGSIIFFISFFTLPYSKPNNFLRIVFIALFVPSALLYAKWTRFLAPVYPIFLLIFALGIRNAYAYLSTKSNLISNIFIATVLLLLLVPGVSYVSIYSKQDVRFVASEWMYRNIPEKSHILFETANVVDVPLHIKEFESIAKSYSTTSFDFYHVDSDPQLQEQLVAEIEKADYIIVPSRRVYYNYTCLRPNDFPNYTIANELWEGKYPDHCKDLRKRYPVLYGYYQQLFSGELGFELVETFSSNPRISFFEKSILAFPDEQAEETWTVFDHPVIRIYKRI